MSKEKLLNQQLQKALANENLTDVKKYLKAGADILDNSILVMRIKNSEIINTLVPYISENTKEKQTKNKISPERYQEYISRFLKFEYSIEEANKIIFQKKYCSAIDDLLHQSHSKLIALGYQHKDIVRIASCGASFQNIIKSLLKSNEVLELGFSREEIIKIVARDGGSNNLFALTQHEKLLRAIGFSREEIIKVVAHTGGSNNLQALINYLGHLKQDGTEISKLLTTEMRNVLIKIVAHHGGCNNLLTLIQHEKPLYALGFSREELINIVAHDGGSNNLRALINYTNQLKERNDTEISEPFSLARRDTLVRILAHDGGSKNLAAFTQHEGSLCAIGFTRQELIKVVAHNGGSNNLQTLINYVDHLKKASTEISKLLTADMRDALVKIVARHGGSKNLVALIQHENLSLSIGFSRQELIQVVAHDGGLNNLQTLINYVDHLKQEGIETSKLLATEMRNVLIKIVAHDGGSKNLVALLENEFTIERLGLYNDKRIYSLLQRKAGHQRLKIFLYYYLFFYHYNAVKTLLTVCCIGTHLSEEKLNTILALNALFYYLKETTNENKANLDSWNSSRFPDELSLLNTIIKIVNRKLKSDIYLLKLQGDNYRITSQMGHSIILQQIEKKLIQYSSSNSLQLQELLNIRNADCFRLLQNPEGNKEVYWLDVRPWKRVFPDQNLQITLTKLLKKGVKDGDILLEERESSSQTLSIFHIGKHALSVPIGVIETIINDYPNLHCYQLILSNYVPTDLETKSGILYLYKTDKTLECVVKDDKKIDNLVIDTSSLTFEQNNEISQAFASFDLTSQLHQSTLKALLRLILDAGKNYFFSIYDSNEIIEFIDQADIFFSNLEDKLVTVTKINKSFLPDNLIQATLTSPSKITVLVNDNNANGPNETKYLSMPIIEVSPIRAASKSAELSFVTLGEIENNLVVGDQLEPNNKRPNEIKKSYEPKRKLTPVPVFINQKKIKKNEVVEYENKSVFEINYFSKSGIFLGEGSYNRAYRFGPIVQKTRKNTAFEMDGAKRAVRVFNEINNALNSEPEKGKLINDNTWELPFIDGNAPSIEKLSETILEIYRTTERVLIDGYCKDNILKDKQSGKLYCIDPGLAVRRNSVISNDYWHKPNEIVRTNKHVHYKYMVELVTKYKENKKPHKSLPIFCIFGIDFYDKNLVEKYGKIHDFCYEAFLVLGIAVYYSILSKSKLNADACLQLLRQDIKIEFGSLKKSYAEKGIEQTKTILKPLFFFPKYKTTNELPWGLTTFQPKRQKVNDEIISQAVFRAKVSQ